MTKTDYENMKVAELTAICRGNAKYANYSRCMKKADLINHMIWCDERETKAQQASEEVAASVPAPEAVAAPVATPMPDSKPAVKQQTVSNREREAQYQRLTVGHLRHLCKINGYNYADAFACNKAELIELLLEIPETREVEEPEPIYQPVRSMVVPALSKPATVTPEEYMDDIAMPAEFWSCQITNSLTWGRWRFGEGESRQHGKYLSIANSELGRHWIILWDWRSFEAACKELIWGLTRLGERAFLPSPGYLPAPPAEDEEPADGEGDGHPGGDPRRESLSTYNQPEDIPWNPADFGEVEHMAEPDGQLTIFWQDNHEPPDPDDFSKLEEFEEAWEVWQQSQPVGVPV